MCRNVLKHATLGKFVSLVALGIYFTAINEFPTTRIVVTPPNNNGRNREDGYLAYLPHSGTSNQWAALENAFMAAYLTNRTLVIPPLYLGHVAQLPWRPLERLIEAIRRIELYSNDDPTSDSTEPLSLATVAWEQLLNLSSLPDTVRYISMADFIRRTKTLKSVSKDVMVVGDSERYAYKLIDDLPGGSGRWFIDNHNNRLPLEPVASNSSNSRWFVLNATVCRQQNSQHQTFLHSISAFYNTESRDPWSFPSNYLTKLNNEQQVGAACPPLNSLINISAPRPLLTNAAEPLVIRSNDGSEVFVQIPMKRFSHLLNLAALQMRRKPPRLLLFSSLFGAGRLLLFRNESNSMRDKLRSALVISNPTLLRLVDEIVSLMGGPGEFMAAHIRGSDGGFAAKLPQTIGNASAILQQWTAEFRSTENRLFNKSGRFKRLYLASDIQQISDHFSAVAVEVFNISRFHRQLKRFDRQIQLQMKQTAGKMTGLFDALDSINDAGIVNFSPLPNNTRKPRLKVKSRYDGDVSSFMQLWIPLVEQLICSRAFGVVGTVGSTFSSYIQHLHVVYWQLPAVNNSRFIFA